MSCFRPGDVASFFKEATIADSSVLYFYQVTMRVRSITAANNYGLLLKGAVTEGLRIVELEKKSKYC